MHCPFCRHADSRVIDSRTSDDGLSIRRRRQCPECGGRFSTIETASLNVIKRSGVTEPFSRDKVMSGVRKACQGRPVTEGDLALLAQAATRLAATAPLVIRTPLAGDDPRGRLTRLTDRVGHLSGWMRTAPRDYPSRDDLLAALADQGLQASCTPLFGNTPFNNWLLVARRH